MSGSVASVTAAWNVARLLRRQIETLLRQTGPLREGSSDEGSGFPALFQASL